MDKFINPQSVLLLFILVRTGDLAVEYAKGNAIVRAILYGLVFLAALITAFFLFR